MRLTWPGCSHQRRSSRRSRARCSDAHSAWHGGDRGGVAVSLRFDVISLFPELFAPFTEAGVARRAFESGQIVLRLWNPRDFAEGNYRRVDDRPFGGGPGMVMMAEPLARCLRAVQADRTDAPPVLLFSPVGQVLNHAAVEHWSAGAGARSAKRGSIRTSGCQRGGAWKRWRSAVGVRRSGATMGRCSSTPATGTWRGSKLGSLDNGVNGGVEAIGEVCSENEKTAWGADTAGGRSSGRPENGPRPRVKRRRRPAWPRGRAAFP